jgi:hypothetical protein
MKMKLNFTILGIFTFNLCFAQTIIGEKEFLGKLILGDTEGTVKYAIDDEGFYSPGSPIVDDKGVLWFTPFNRDKMINFSDGNFKVIDYPDYYPKPTGQTTGAIISQSGLFGYYTGFPDDIWSWPIKNGITRYSFTNYSLPGGIIYEVSGNKGSEKIRTYISLEFDPYKFSMTENIHRYYTIRDPDETRVWLPTQLGGFSIGEDDLLYRNGILWSAVNEPVYGKHSYSYIGHVASGHAIWVGGGRLNSPGEFIITNPDGSIEMLIDLPWRKAVESEWYQYNYGLGPWGEIYFLLPPAFIPVSKGKSGDGIQYDIYGPDASKPAELVVVRNHLKYFGRLNDGRVHLRRDPNTTSEILGTYPNKTGFRILETGTKSEAIAGQTNVWYRVRLLDGTEGWFFGAFVHNLYDGPNGNPPPWPNVPDW